MRRCDARLRCSVQRQRRPPACAAVPRDRQSGRFSRANDQRARRQARTHPLYIAAARSLENTVNVQKGLAELSAIGAMHQHRVDFRDPLHGYPLALLDGQRMAGRFQFNQRPDTAVTQMHMRLQTQRVGIGR